MNVLIVGYGKMGQLIDALATEQGIGVAGRVDDGRDEWRAADVAIDFTTADALRTNFPRYLEMKMPVVIGTTGWGQDAASFRRRAEAAGTWGVRGAGAQGGEAAANANVACRGRGPMGRAGCSDCRGACRTAAARP